MNSFHSVTIDRTRCKGCINCMKRCPTEAIRVREGKARIMYERCIGCGECVRHCPTSAKKEFYDTMDITKNFKYKVAVPSPSLYGQFNNLPSPDYLLTAIKRLGFDDVVEVGLGAEYVSGATAEYIK
ncbi:MAG: 4Fe-4S dicluster domain-containing protein, partial [Clostridia bacterium]|nr:4Fe-4S dicluster domain-containing protein [Clostridia bacterium]